MENKLYYNGKWQLSKSNEVIEVLNPIDQSKLGEVASGTAEDMNLIINSAAMAQKSFGKTSSYYRSGLLEKIYKGIMDQKHVLAEIMTKENGKPLNESLGEVNYAASFIKWYAEEAKRVGGELIPGTSENRRIMVIKQPVGIVYAITPWNFPLAMITRKLAPALAAGCTFILKPSEETPLTAIKLFEIIDGLDVPKGVVNLITGEPVAMTMQVMSDKRVRKITFTGSTAVGKKLMIQSAANLKNISLELGGHAPLIVFDDADLDKAVEGTMASKFRNCGQACIASNRIYVHKNIEAAYIEKLTVAIKKLKVGDGMMPFVTIGPIINKRGYDKIKYQIQDAVSKDAKLIYGGECEVNEQNAYFVSPTILTNISDEMAMYREETFGPVVPIITFQTDAEVIDLANDTDYGLAAYLFTESVSRGFRVSEALEYGIIGFNTGSPSSAQAPFGGYKESGLGREGGREGIEAYLETKYIALDL